MSRPCDNYPDTGGLSRKGTSPLGRRAVLDHHPHHRPGRLKSSPAPEVHAATAAARKIFLEALKIFLGAYRAASAKFRSGDLTVEFPGGSFLPHAPFVEPRGALVVG